MNVIKFSEQITNNNIVYCIVDKTSSYTNQWAKELIKNISDWTIQNITCHGYTVLVSPDEDSLLQEAVKLNYTHAVVLSTGTEFVNGYAFLDYAKDFCESQDYFIAGHILDRKDFYYELHEQCYVINLSYYVQVGMPTIGAISYYDSHDKTVPKRSEENIHDDYTPVWVTRGIAVKKYTHKCHGWNIISTALDNKLPLVVFDQNFRDNKKHYYPEYINSFTKEINFVHKRESFCSGLAVYPFNSERPHTNQMQGPIEQLVVPAAGLNWVLDLHRIGYTKDTVVKFYDYSLPTLELMRSIVEWDGNDYVGFVQQFINNKFSFISENRAIPYCGPQDLEKAWDSFCSEINWQETWSNIRKLKFEFHWADLLDFSGNLDWIEQDRVTLINLSNIFNYIGTATFRNTRERIYAENRLITELKQRIPTAYIIARRASAGFVVDNINWPTLVSNLPLTDIQQLTKPSWHYNQDWTN